MAAVASNSSNGTNNSYGEIYENREENMSNENMSNNDYRSTRFAPTRRRRIVPRWNNSRHANMKKTPNRSSGQRRRSIPTIRILPRNTQRVQKGINQLNRTIRKRGLLPTMERRVNWIEHSTLTEEEKRNLYDYLLEQEESEFYQKVAHELAIAQSKNIENDFDIGTYLLRKVKKGQMENQVANVVFNKFAKYKNRL
jgi:hypothetical protein